MNKAKLAAVLGAGVAAASMAIITQWEGTIFRTYRDPIGVVTACTGHTGPELRMGQKFTREQCEEMLAADILKHAKALECVRTPLNDNQKAAFISFAFNVGVGAFCRSGVARKANAGDLPGACAQLSRWTYAGGKNCADPANGCYGLYKRRAAERRLCETPP